MAEATGFRAIYLSGGGVAANSLGMPDLGITTMEDVLTDVRRITDACTLPLLVDIDTGWGSAFNIARTIRSMIKAGAAAVHMEDQVGAKRCGHRPGKELVSSEEMVDRIKAAVDARTDEHFVFMARTDALANEGLKQPSTAPGLRRRRRRHDLPRSRSPTSTCTSNSARPSAFPILANITEFGQTPLLTTRRTRQRRRRHHPLLLRRLSRHERRRTAVYETIRTEGTQKHLVPTMQSRADLYKYLDYHSYEEKLDALFAKSKDRK